MRQSISTLTVHVQNTTQLALLFATIPMLCNGWLLSQSMVLWCYQQQIKSSLHGRFSTSSFLASIKQHPMVQQIIKATESMPTTQCQSIRCHCAFCAMAKSEKSPRENNSLRETVTPTLQFHLAFWFFSSPRKACDVTKSIRTLNHWTKASCVNEPNATLTCWRWIECSNWTHLVLSQKLQRTNIIVDWSFSPKIHCVQLNTTKRITRPQQGQTIMATWTMTTTWWEMAESEACWTLHDSFITDFWICMHQRWWCAWKSHHF